MTKCAVLAGLNKRVVFYWDDLISIWYFHLIFPSHGNIRWEDPYNGLNLFEFDNIWLFFLCILPSTDLLIPLLNISLLTFTHFTLHPISRSGITCRSHRVPPWAPKLLFTPMQAMCDPQVEKHHMESTQRKTSSYT